MSLSASLTYDPGPHQIVAGPGGSGDTNAAFMLDLAQGGLEVTAIQPRLSRPTGT
jgi:hypothetical protein